MSAKIIAVFNQKGGAGKTTIAVNVAGTLGNRGHKVMIVDLDPQGTASIWTTLNEEKAFPARINNLVQARQIHREIEQHIDAYDFIVIDCPPAAESAAPSVALLIADLGIVPVGASGGNLWATEKVKQLVEQARASGNEALIVRSVANMDQNVAIVRQIFDALEKDEELKPFETRLGLRAAYKEAEVMGVVVGEVPRARAAAKEMDSLVNEILNCLA
ncbi:ParA family protein [Pandoraea sputorum]|uniref:Cobyrinic acid a,c-diamide synthase n=1 Tax=Pandoraea sputorum TaxID=93222 RepID=A0A5E5BDY0_9BURK|nr:ParA family protein [Pandoraea sputorum]VVE84411.1 cobyrinic acid a,c-diamide synthase [Pandoraea sputorum]